MKPRAILWDLFGDHLRYAELVASYRALPFRDPDLPTARLPEGWQGRRAHTLFTTPCTAPPLPMRATPLTLVIRSA